jgi:hypothetical protein
VLTPYLNNKTSTKVMSAMMPTNMSALMTEPLSFWPAESPSCEAAGRGGGGGVVAARRSWARGMDHPTSSSAAGELRQCARRSAPRAHLLGVVYGRQVHRAGVAGAVRIQDAYQSDGERHADRHRGCNPSDLLAQVVQHGTHLKKLPDRFSSYARQGDTGVLKSCLCY